MYAFSFAWRLIWTRLKLFTKDNRRKSIYPCKNLMYFSKISDYEPSILSKKSHHPPSEARTLTIYNLIILLKQCSNCTPSTRISCLYEAHCSRSYLSNLSWEVSPYYSFLEQFSEWHYALYAVMSTHKARLQALLELQDTEEVSSSTYNLVNRKGASKAFGSNLIRDTFPLPPWTQ